MSNPDEKDERNLFDRIHIEHGFITNCDATFDAIVNATDQTCRVGDVLEAGGDELKQACQHLPIIDTNVPNVRCATGDACITPGGRLNTKWCIHAVGPTQESISLIDETLALGNDLLYSAYVQSLFCAKENKLRKIAFPVISDDVFRTNSDIIKIALYAIAHVLWSAHGSIKDVYLICQKNKDYETAKMLHSNPKLWLNLSSFNMERIIIVGDKFCKRLPIREKKFYLPKMPNFTIRNDTDNNKYIFTWLYVNPDHDKEQTKQIIREYMICYNSSYNILYHPEITSDYVQSVAKYLWEENLGNSVTLKTSNTIYDAFDNQSKTVVVFLLLDDDQYSIDHIHELIYYHTYRHILNCVENYRSGSTFQLEQYNDNPFMIASTNPSTFPRVADIYIRIECGRYEVLIQETRKSVCLWNFINGKKPSSKSIKDIITRLFIEHVKIPDAENFIQTKLLKFNQMQIRYCYNAKNADYSIIIVHWNWRGLNFDDYDVIKPYLVPKSLLRTTNAVLFPQTFLDQTHDKTNVFRFWPGLKKNTSNTNQYLLRFAMIILLNGLKPIYPRTLYFDPDHVIHKIKQNIYYHEKIFNSTLFQKPIYIEKFGERVINGVMFADKDIIRTMRHCCGINVFHYDFYEDLHQNDFIKVILNQQNKSGPEYILNVKTFYYQVSYPLFSNSYIYHRTCAQLDLRFIQLNPRFSICVDIYKLLQETYLNNQYIPSYQYFTKFAQQYIFDSKKILTYTPPDDELYSNNVPNDCEQFCNNNVRNFYTIFS